MKLVILMVSFTMLYAHMQWPEMYAYLGNPVYEDALAYRELVDLDAFSNEQAMLQDYIEQSDALLQQWRQQEDTTDHTARLNYLNALRELSAYNHMIQRRLSRRFETLWDEGNMALLHTIALNASGFVANVPAVKRAAEFDMPLPQEHNESLKLQSPQELPEPLDDATPSPSQPMEVVPATLHVTAGAMPMPVEVVLMDGVALKAAESNATSVESNATVIPLDVSELDVEVVESNTTLVSSDVAASAEEALELNNTDFAVTTIQPDSADGALERVYQHYKHALLQARSEGREDRCLNDVTALYSFLVLLERAVEQNSSCEALDLQSKAAAFNKTASGYCDPSAKMLRDAQEELSKYDKKTLKQLCDEKSVSHDF